MFHYTPRRRLDGQHILLLLIYDLGTRWRWVISVTSRQRFIPGEMTPGTHCTGGLVGPRAGLDTEARGKILCLCRGSNLVRSVVQPVARYYTDWATPDHVTVLRYLIFKDSYVNWACPINTWAGTENINRTMLCSAQISNYIRFETDQNTCWRDLFFFKHPQASPLLSFSLNNLLLSIQFTCWTPILPFPLLF
jgi:hypothetical protein